jgi:hypothetical protein
MAEPTQEIIVSELRCRVQASMAESTQVLGLQFASLLPQEIQRRSYWIPGSYVTSISMSAPSNALPPLADIVHKLEEPQVERKFLLCNTPVWTQPTP